ncbi:MAG TPA: hypothetical protein VKS24_03450 [Bradyrhizobium sp.]|nr:hypothetical protein [Bradyrhizobium sp.]
MAEIAKLSVGKVFEKLRSADAPKRSKMMRLEEEVRTAEEEVQRLRTARVRLKRGQPGGTTGRS